MDTHRSTLRALALLVFVIVAAGVADAVFAEPASAHTVTRADCRQVASLYPPGSTIRRIVGRTCSGLADRHARVHTCARTDLSPFAAIDCTWPPALRSSAKVLAECESTASASASIARARGLGRWAVNGQYRGMFQLGTNERAAHGEYRVGDDARRQARSALSLYRDRGWQPWTASGNGGTRCHALA